MKDLNNPEVGHIHAPCCPDDPVEILSGMELICHYAAIYSIHEDSIDYLSRGGKNPETLKKLSKYE